MLIVTNYPQVPIATSNVATDLARADNQQAKPILPPQESTSAHHERALNQKNESLARYDVIEEKYRQQQKQQSTGQEATQQQSSIPRGVLPQLLRIAANNNPTIQRRDIQAKMQSSTSSASSEKAAIQSQLLTEHLANQPDEFYQQLGQRVGDYYHQQTTPQPKNYLSALV